jgi:hypothetical protein
MLRIEMACAIIKKSRETVPLDEKWAHFSSFAMAKDDSLLLTGDG